MKLAKIVMLSLVTLSLMAGLPAGVGAASGPKIVEVHDSNVEELAAQGFPLSFPAPRIDAPNAAQVFQREVEPNGTAATATPLTGTDLVALGNIYPTADNDFFSFTAALGDRVYAATMTSFSASSPDSVLDLIASDGVTVIESDDNDGSITASSSTLSGVLIPSAGTYYLRVIRFGNTSQIRPYELHLRIQSGAGAPTAEVEPNDFATPNPLPASGWVSGTVDPAAEFDVFSFTANAGDTVFLSLDMNPERDAGVFNGRLGLGIFNTFVLIVNDGNTGATTPNSEAFFMTVRDTGTYFAYVDAATGAGPTATYNLSVSVHPAEVATSTNYVSANVPLVIPAGPGVVDSTLVVPGNPRIADLNVQISLNHTNWPDLDVALISPAGNEVSLYTDAALTAGQTIMDFILDDEAGIPISNFGINTPMVYTPEFPYRLSWFDGEDAGGTWTLRIRDDTAANGGNLVAWSLNIIEPAAEPACIGPALPVTVFSTDFEAGAAGFTSSGVANEWALGLPSFAPITTCNSGVNCFKTDLTGTYNASSAQDLLSPAISLAGLQGPVRVRWAQKHQMENAFFDGAFVEVREAGGANPRILWRWLDATMTDSVGNPATPIQESAGWALMSYDISEYAGLNIELRFHLDSETSVQLGGLAIDDVVVTACVSPGITVSPTSGLVTTEAGGTATFTVNANTPPAFDVIVGLTSDDPSEGTVPVSVTLPAGSTATQTVTVTGVDDAIDDGDIAYTIVTAPAVSADPGYSGLNASDVSATNTDDDTAGITVVPTSGLVTTEAGGTATFTVNANTPPAFDVIVGLTSDDPGEGTVPVSVTLPAGSTAPQTVTVTGADDFIDDGDIAYTIVTAAAVSADPGYSGVDASDVSATNTDDDTAGITVVPTSGLVTTEAGDTATFTIVLDTQPTGDVTIALSSADTTEGTVSPTSVTFTTAPGDFSTPRTITLTGVGDFIDDGDIAYAIVTAAAVSADPGYSGLDASDVSATNIDDDTAGITVVPTSGLVTTETGGTATFTIVLDTQPSGDVTIALSSSDTTEGTVSPASVTFNPGNFDIARVVTLTGVADALADGDIAYTIVTAPAVSSDPNYDGLDAANVSATNLDDPCGIDTTAPVVTPPAALVVDQSTCSGSNPGATGDTSPSLAAFLVGDSATDNCDVSPIRLSPQVGGVGVDNTTFFPVGTTTVTFRWQDSAGNTGTATSDVTVVIFYADLNEDGLINAGDSVILSNFLVGNLTQGSAPFTAPLAAADINVDGSVNAVDAVILSNFLVGNISCLPSTGSITVVNVDIMNFAFAPATVTVSAGTRIVWTNRDAASHSVIGGNLTSPTLGPDETYVYTTSAADLGTTNYVCGFHGFMTGSLTVN